VAQYVVDLLMYELAAELPWAPAIWVTSASAPVSFLYSTQESTAETDFRFLFSLSAS